MSAGTLYIIKYDRNYFKCKLRKKKTGNEKSCWDSFECFIANFYEELKENIRVTIVNINLLYIWKKR